MPRKVIGGLIQAATPLTDSAAPFAEVKEAALAVQIPLIEEAARRGVQILGFQEVFNGPCFCPSQGPHWYDLAEPAPGPTTDRIGAYAKKYQMAMVVPVYEREQAGVYYNTAAVYDADGSYLGKYCKNHIPQTSGFWEKYFFKPGNPAYPVFKTRFASIGVYICYDRHFPEGARLLGLNGAEIVFNPSATVAGLSQYLWKLEQRRTLSPTATSWRAAIASAPRRRRTSAASTDRRTSSIRAATSSPRGPRTKPSSSSRKWTST